MSKFLLGLFSVATIVLVLTYLFSCLTPYINPANFWPITFLGLIFPILAFAFICCIAIWFLLNKKIGLFLLIIFFVGYKNLFSVFAFNFSSDNLVKQPGHLRVMDWNVRRFNSNKKSDERPNGIRRQMINYIRQVNPDVLMMQEFVEIQDSVSYSNIKLLKDSLGFKYYYTSSDQITHAGQQEYGCAIFSKYPIENPIRLTYPGITVNESISSVDINYKGAKIRVATTHLVSLNLGEPPDKGEFFKRRDSYFILHSSQFEKLKHYDSIHGRQANFVKRFLDKSPYPVIVSGDFNSVPSSYTYHTIKGKLKDAFLKRGFGFGNTYVGLSPTLRIDYILVDKAFKVRQFMCNPIVLSDHYPLFTDLELKE